MANREKGEVSVDIAGTSYTLVLNFDARCAAEDKASTPDKEVTWDQLLERAGRGSARATRIVMWAMFQKYHPTVKVEDVNGLIDAAGGIDGLQAAMQASLLASLPDPKDTEALGVGRPRGAQASAPAGEHSTSRPVALV